MRLLVLILLFTGAAWARPEYAVKQNVNCTSCHLNAWGGGPRNVYGKIYGSRGYNPSKISLQDTYAASLRGIAYYPKAVQNSSSGLAFMEASVSANVIPIETAEDTSEVRIVGTYNMSPLRTELREAYVRIVPASAATTYIQVGRFNPPFGLMTDEHRTYTRIQSASTINHFVTGGAVSTAFINNLFFDFALVQDFQSSGNFSSQNIQYGAVANARYMIQAVPVMVGASQNMQHIANQPEPYATSLYTMLSVDRWTGGSLPLAVGLEGVTARGWNAASTNPRFGNFFIPSTNSAYQTAISQSQSLGVYSWIRYDVKPTVSLFYKWDSLTPDTNYSGDAYLRHGLGAEVMLNSNTYINARVEVSDVTRSDVAGTNAPAAQSDFLAMLRLWL